MALNEIDLLINFLECRSSTLLFKFFEAEYNPLSAPNSWCYEYAFVKVDERGHFVQGPSRLA